MCHFGIQCQQIKNQSTLYRPNLLYNINAIIHKITDSHCRKNFKGILPQQFSAKAYTTNEHHSVNCQGFRAAVHIASLFCRQNNKDNISNCPFYR